MNNIFSTIFPSSQQNMPIPSKQKSVGLVPEDNFLKDNYNWAIAPKNYKAAENDINLTLPQSPKDTITSDPTCVNKRCHSKRPFKRNKCYMLYSPSQNMWGPVCGDGGYNANFARGNEFGLDYNFYKVFRRPEYKIDGSTYSKKNPVIVSHNYSYFPFPDYYNRFKKQYKTFPYFNLYKKGQPIYTYPYNTLQNYSPVVENFNNNNKIGKYMCNISGIAIIILIIIYFLNILKK